MANDKNSNAVRIDTLPSEQLQHLGKQLEQDLFRLQQSAQLLASLAGEYQVSESAVQDLKELEEGADLTSINVFWVSGFPAPVSHQMKMCSLHVGAVPL
jgi:hypothetical protein